MDARQLTPEQVRDYCSAIENLKATGATLSSAITEYVEAKRSAGNAHLVQAAQFFVRYAGDKISVTRVQDVIQKLTREPVDRRGTDGGRILQHSCNHQGSPAAGNPQKQASQHP